jgi:hypothetical protein
MADRVPNFRGRRQADFGISDYYAFCTLYAWGVISTSS